MKKVYDALTIAKWIINKIHPEPLKLQKLLYLAQGYLNLMEEQKANIIPNQIECNGMKYMIKQKEIFQDDIDEISIEISWRYHDQEEMEYQEREIKREVIK